MMIHGHELERVYVNNNILPITMITIVIAYLLLVYALLKKISSPLSVLTLFACMFSLIIVFILLFYPINYVLVELSIDSKTITNIAILILSLIVMLSSLNVIDLTSSLILMYVFVFFILVVPGYVVLTLIYMIVKDEFSVTEYIVFSHAISLSFTSVVTLVRIAMNSISVYEDFVKYFVMLTSFSAVTISLYSLHKAMFSRNTAKKTCIKLADVIVLMFIVIVLALVISFNWVMSSVCCITDYPRLYRMMLRFIHYGFHSNIPYPWSIGLYSIIHVYLRKISPFTLFKIVSLGSLFLLLSMYLFYKRIIPNVNACIISLILWSMSGGFSWILLFNNTIVYSMYSEGLGFWIWLNYRPITMGFTLLFTLIYLLLLNTKRGLSYLVALILVPLPFFHIPEYLLAVSLILGLCLIRNDSKLLYPTLMSIAINYMFALFSGLSLFSITFISMAILILFFIGRVRRGVLKCLKSIIEILESMIANKYFMVLLTSMVFGSIVETFLGFKSINGYIAKIMWTLFPVPLSIYTVVIGPLLLVIILALLIDYSIKSYTRSKYVYIVLLVIVLFFVARIVTFADILSVYMFSKSGIMLPLYYEKRVLSLAYPFLIAVVASIMLRYRQLILRFIFMLLVLVGLIQLPIYVASRTADISSFLLDYTEMKLVDKLVNMYYSSDNYIIFGLPELLIKKLEYLPSTAYTLIYNDVLFSSSSPEIVFYLLSLHEPSTIMYIVDSRTANLLNQMYKNSYVYNKIIPYTRSRERIGSIIMYKQFSFPVPPSSNSTMAALDSDTVEILGFMRLNYTVLTSMDCKLFRGICITTGKPASRNTIRVSIDYSNECRNFSAPIGYADNSIVIHRACIYDVNNTSFATMYLSRILANISGKNIHLIQVMSDYLKYKLPYLAKQLDISGETVVKTNYLIILSRYPIKNNIIVGHNITIYCKGVRLGKGFGFYINITCTNVLVKANNSIIYNNPGATTLLFRGGVVSGKGKICIRGFKVLPIRSLPRYVFDLLNIRVNTCYNGFIHLHPVIHGDFLLASDVDLSGLIAFYIYRYIVNEALLLIKTFILGLPFAILVFLLRTRRSRKVSSLIP